MIAIWLTGVPAVGKTTIAKLLAPKLDAVIVDGDDLRARIDLGADPFSKEARDRNVLLGAREARSVLDSGQNVIVAMVSPYTEARRQAVALLGPQCLLVWLHCPIEVLRKRDPKGLYEKQTAGVISGLTGVDAPFEPPDDALLLDTSSIGAEYCVQDILTACSSRF